MKHRNAPRGGAQNESADLMEEADPPRERRKPKRLHDIAAGLGMKVGCGDNSCIWGPPHGMGTNGGCRCNKGPDGIDSRVTALQMKQVAQHLLNVINTVIDQKEE